VKPIALEEGDAVNHRNVPPEARVFARTLRANLTDAEVKLWRILRSRRLSSLKGRRQVPVGRYIVDFICFEYRLVVECDGSQHADNFRDAIRDAWLIKEGFVVARVWNHEILQSPRMVEDTIFTRAGLPV
jgi:very-short-patch-repair endonuclease